MIGVHSISKEVKLRLIFFFFRILPRFCVTVVFTGFLSTLNIYNLPTELLGVAKQLKIMTFLQQKTWIWASLNDSNIKKKHTQELN